MARFFLDGNEAISRAAVDAGCRFFAGYPITPATTIFHQMVELLPPIGGICLQGEDEIASIGFCIGASMAGLKAMTATSGPGISLYSEQISFAIGGEIPLVIVDVQRLGPSTGSATKGADGDIQFLRWGNSGGLPVIVLAPVDAIDCYRLTGHAFNLAERFRCPVFIASNKEIGMTRESVEVAELQLPPTIDRTLCPAEVPFLPFQAPTGSDVPYFLPMGGQRLVRQTSSTHGADGYITVDTEQIGTAIRRLARKIDGAVDDFSFYEMNGAAHCETLVITYGVTARAARQAISTLRLDGHNISLLVLKTLFPVPVKVLEERIRTTGRIVLIEMNLGLYLTEIARLCLGKEMIHHTRMDGELISPEEICAVIRP
ncbi:MAG: pyruvate flavodoxin/ferredoxin oxidoreductase [Desulfofustis sp.]|nr:pyruvate flavodoxin/ferredoxin oxidoreductase [Desulfofustis sp.]